MMKVQIWFSPLKPAKNHRKELQFVSEERFQVKITMAEEYLADLRFWYNTPISIVPWKQIMLPRTFVPFNISTDAPLIPLPMVANKLESVIRQVSIADA
mmetsp:Transcript_28273/g.41513  ORF Transcript_28273/g.41513 Transcript_28273/m.41513 type:complete len:99 (+) Transcript_28273:466-762(+)